ncbi:MAG: glycosyltransferase family 4 protein, partial [Mycobacteriales bacterium]
MKILVVTPYPPARDGIAAYAAQTVRSLRREGHDVEVLSPGPSAAHFHLDLLGPRGGLALAKRIRQGRYDRVIVQFHPDFFYPVPNTARDRLRVAVGLLAAFRLAGRVEVIVHEIDYRFGRPTTPDGAAARLLWRSVDSVGVHTEGERTHFAKAFGVPMSKIVLISHGADFAKHTQHSRASARDSLSVPAGEFMFLSIGFVQEHKGFDRAVTAFAGLGARGSRLDIVGSVRVDDAHQLAYGNSLDVLAAATDGVHRHTGYVSDELFDRWIVAADALVLPYRSIWSSGVLERAALYDTPVIATAVGGLPEQAIAPGPGVPATGRRDVRLVEDDAELRQVMWERAGARGGSPRAGAAWPADGVDLRSRIQREVARRAVGSRGTRVAAAVAAGPGDSADAGGAGDPAEVARAADISRSSAPIRRVATLH